MNAVWALCASHLAWNLVAAAHSKLADPVALWTFQEPTGAGRVSLGMEKYTLVDGNVSSPILRIDGGVFGAFSAYFAAKDNNNSQRLYADRADVPALTSGIAGPDATVTTIAWIRRNATDTNKLSSEAMVAGCWNEHMKARQYALFTNLGACSSSPDWHGGLASHISNCGGPTPGYPYCETRACDPRPLPEDDTWTCLAGVYNGTDILAYVNGTFKSNNNATRHDNPYLYPGGIFDPETTGRFGAEFAVGANTVNNTEPSFHWSNQFVGRIGGLAVYNTTLSEDDIATVCAAGAGFAHLAYERGLAPWTLPAY